MYVCKTGIPGAKNRGQIELYFVVFAKVTLVRLSNSLGLTKITMTNYYNREENSSNTFRSPPTQILRSYTPTLDSHQHDRLSKDLNITIHEFMQRGGVNNVART